MLYALLCILSISQALATLTKPVDLGYKFDANTVYWIGSGNFTLTPTVRQESPFWLASNAYSAAEHGGTHVDAPYHFNKAGWKIGDIPLERLLVEGVVIDLKSEAANYPDFEVKVEHLVAWERYNGPLPNQVVLLFNFDWAKKYTNTTAYYGGNTKTSLHFPGVSKDAATWIVKSEKVVGVGVDTPSIDPGTNTEFIAHQILSKANIYFIENLALANVNLPPRDFQLAILPMKIAEGTGAPLRIIAYPKNQSIFSTILSSISSILRLFGLKV